MKANLNLYVIALLIIGMKRKMIFLLKMNIKITLKTFTKNNLKFNQEPRI